MIVDPYAPPRALLESPCSDPPMPRGIRWQIRGAVSIGALFAVVTLINAIRAYSAHVPLVYVAYRLTAVVVIAGLAYGTHRGGRTCAVLLLLTLLPQGVWLLIRDGITAASILALVVLGSYGVGVVGTFRWRRLRDEYRRTAANAPATC